MAHTGRSRIDQASALAGADDVRVRAVDEAEALVRAHGVSALRLDAVAAACGVHRSTLHRHYSSKEAVIAAVLARVTQRAGATVATKLGRRATPRQLLGEGMVLALDLLAQDEVFRSLVEPSASGLVARVADDVLREGLRPLVVPMFEAARSSGVLRSDITVDMAAEWLFVVASGLLRSAPLLADSERVRDLLEKMLVPSLLVDEAAPARRGRQVARASSSRIAAGEAVKR